MDVYKLCRNYPLLQYIQHSRRKGDAQQLFTCSHRDAFVEDIQSDGRGQMDALLGTKDVGRRCRGA